MPGYYDIDTILAEEELIPTTTADFDFSYLSHLHPDRPATGLPAGSKVQLPVWVAKVWAYQGYAKVAMPKQYGRAVQERLAAEPTDVDLR